MAKRRILVLGGGFAGVGCIRRLESYLGGDPDIELVLVSENNFLLFTPMLPQVASGMIETRHIVIPIRDICKKTTVFYESRVKSIDPYGKVVNLWGRRGKRGIRIHYDYLVIALGSETNFFDLGSVERHAYTMKTLDDAVILRNHVIDMLEQSENETDPVRLRGQLTFVVVGGGFAGIETAGEMMDLLVDASDRYPHVQKSDIRVVVVEALPTILPGFSKGLAEFAYEKLKERNIEIMTRTAVTSFDGEEVIIKDIDGDSEPRSMVTKTLIWTAGVTPANTIKRSVLKTERGRIVVNGFLEVPEHSGVFAIGDCASLQDPKTKRQFAPTAQIAEAQAKIAAHNLYSSIRGGEKRRFVFSGRGQMAIIGKRSGIASIFGINVSGFLAWFLWRAIYLSKIPILEKRTRVSLDWLIDLFFRRDIARLKAVGEKAREYQDLDEVDDLW